MFRKQRGSTSVPVCLCVDGGPIRKQRLGRIFYLRSAIGSSYLCNLVSHRIPRPNFPTCIAGPPTHSPQFILLPEPARLFTMWHVCAYP